MDMAEKAEGETRVRVDEAGVKITETSQKETMAEMEAV